MVLPDYVDAEKIKAKYENGVLTITIPKREEVKTKIVDVKVE
jgi:HSP20 family protein